MKLIKSFLKYQQERFPLLFLIPVSLSGVIGTAAILGLHSYIVIVSATCLMIAFLFHVRVIDEIRDFAHDSEFHSYRPIQRNIISIKQLKILRLISLVIFFGISFLSSYSTLIFATLLFLYSTIAANDFFCHKIIKKYFYLYNLLNMVQLIGLQLVVYTMFDWNFDLTKIVIAHFAIIFFLSAILEIVRKIKLVENETKGNDTYSAHLGYRGSILLFAWFFAIVLLPLQYVFLENGKIYGIIIPVVICTIGLYISKVHSIKKNQKTEKLILIFSLMYYLTINIMLYLLV